MRARREDTDFPYGTAKNFADQEAFGVIMAAFAPASATKPSTSMGQPIQVLIAKHGVTVLDLQPTNGISKSPLTDTAVVAGTLEVLEGIAPSDK